MCALIWTGGYSIPIFSENALEFVSFVTESDENFEQVVYYNIKIVFLGISLMQHEG